MDQTTPQSIQSQIASVDQIKKLEEKIKTADVSEELRALLVERTERLLLLKSSGTSSNANYILEYENTARYVNWVISLPWNKKTEDILDLKKAKDVFDKNHYGLELIKNNLLEYLASIILTMRNKESDHAIRAPILCLVGLAGTGKTTLAQSIAQSLGRKFERIPFGGMSDARVLRGQSRAFPDAEPSVVIKKLIHAGSKNCVILLDELDRVSESARGDIMGVLIELLDPGQNYAFTDHYIDYPFDLSQVLFVATANNTTNIATAVLDRLEIVQMPSYTDAEKEHIGREYIFPKIRRETGLSENQLVIDQNIWAQIIRPLGYDSGIRSLERTIQGICRKSARLIVEEKTQSIQITATNVREFLPS